MPKKNQRHEAGGLPEYPDNVNTQRAAAMKASRGKRLSQAFPTEPLRVQYLTSRIDSCVR